MQPVELARLARRVIEVYRERRLTIVLAESCTGGLLAGQLTEVPGSSAVVERGFVAYANAAKQEMLGVPIETLAAYGAVSEEAARAMAEGALSRAPTDVAVAVTGIAGPDGGSTGKPVGLVHLATAMRGAETRHRRMLYGGIGRRAIRAATVGTALEMLLERAGAVVERRYAIFDLSGWNVLGLLLGAAAVLVGASLLGYTVVRLAHLPQRGPAILALVTVLPSAGVVAWLLLWLRWRSPRVLTRLNPASLSLKHLGFGFAAGLAAALGSLVVVVVTRPFLGSPKAVEQLSLLAGGASPAAFAIILLIGVAMAPFWEEALFRGALYGWCRGRLGVFWSALLVAAGHSLLHFDPAAMPALIAVFFWFGLLLEWTGNLWVPILAHATNNTVAVLAAWVYLAGWLD
jgi:nicotinamide-nucleotide amidase